MWRRVSAFTEATAARGSLGGGWSAVRALALRTSRSQRARRDGGRISTASAGGPGGDVPGRQAIRRAQQVVGAADHLVAFSRREAFEGRRPRRLVREPWKDRGLSPRPCGVGRGWTAPEQVQVHPPVGTRLLAALRFRVVVERPVARFPVVDA